MHAKCHSSRTLRVAVDARPEIGRRLERRQLRVAVVDVRDLERVLVPRVMEVVLVEQLREEAVGLAAQRFEPILGEPPRGHPA